MKKLMLLILNQIKKKTIYLEDLGFHTVLLVWHFHMTYLFQTFIAFNINLRTLLLQDFFYSSWSLGESEWRASIYLNLLRLICSST